MDFASLKALHFPLSSCTAVPWRFRASESQVRSKASLAVFAARSSERTGRDEPDELGWVRRARELAIETMSSRNFTDRDFEALLPAKLRESHQKKRKKKPNLKLAAGGNDDEAVALIKQVAEKRKRRNDSSISDPSGGQKELRKPAPPMQAIDPEAIKALARKFNANRQATKTPENYSAEAVQTELSLLYKDESEAEGMAVDEDVYEDENVMVAVKDPRMQQINLNQDLVDCRDVDEVLETVSRASGRFSLSPINVATALHRIAKHMVSLPMHESKRLRVARQKEMCELVAEAMEFLPESSAQGLSNIAWALSKIGGHILYSGEMELIAATGLEKCGELNPQNVANLAGAFASMQHDAPEFLDKLAIRAAEVASEFRAQELAQVLWGFASLGRAADPLLDALDEVLRECKNGMKQREDSTSTASLVESLVVNEDEEDRDKVKSSMDVEQLSSIAWSYAVFGQLQRPFFAYICEQIAKSSLNQDNSQTGLHTHARQLSQLHQVKLSLELEWSHLGMSLGERVERLAAAAWEKEKTGRKSMSAFQKEMEMFLFCTGRRWVPEYTGADYSLDFALADEKIGIEVNGPSHFSRNTGVALGHMVLKRRLLQASGWKILSASYEEWEKLEGEAAHIAYVKDLVAPHLS